MEIIKYYLHRGKLSEISSRYAVFEKLRDTTNRGVWHDWKEKTKGTISYEKMVLFVGKTGYGKSTTVNAILGREILETSDVSSCTRVCQCLDYEIERNHWISLGDLPGVGESQAKDEEYFKLYGDFLDYAAVIVHVIRADTRDYSIDEETTRRLFSSESVKKRIIYALGQCDKIEPISRKNCDVPTDQQIFNINKKVTEVTRIFSAINPVVPYSAVTGWNLDKLVNKIVEIVNKN